MIYVIGCGGVGSWLIPAMARLSPNDYMVLYDGDRLEERNLDRQLFSKADIGMNKAEAMMMKIVHGATVTANGSYYRFGITEHNPGDVIFCCVDNNAARMAVLNAVDAYGCTAIVAANEEFSAEAYIYKPAWRTTPRDPRVYYPEITVDDGLDPAHVPCTGPAQVAAPQLVSANFMAAALAQSLFVSNIMEAPKMADDVLPYIPYRLVSNTTKLLTFRPIDIQPKEANGK